MPGQRRRVIFRADAASHIGGGHVMRCFTLAEKFIAADWSVGFACISETLTIVPRLRDRVELLDATDGNGLNAKTLAERWPSGCDILVVDHYSLDRHFEASCRGWARHIIVIDDLADRLHDCDFLVDTTLGRNPGDYTGLVPANTLILTGPDYAILRPEFMAVREFSLNRRASLSKVERILVTLGLTDLGGITEQVVRALLQVDAAFTIDVVIGSAASSKAALEDCAAREPRVSLHIDPSNIAELMANADLAIGAGGTTSWERCCLGLPTVMLVLAGNQRLVSDSLTKAGAAITASTDTIAVKADISAKVAHLIENPSCLRGMVIAAAAVVDGRGSDRIIIATQSRFILNQARHVSVRLPTALDSPLILAWRNDPVSRSNFRNSDIVSEADHQLWFARMLANPNNTMLIGEVVGEPIGIVRFDHQVNRDFEVSINLAPQKRGLGLGVKLLEAACAVFIEHFCPSILSAYIKIGNIGSQRIFEACQFERINETDGVVGYQRFNQRVLS